MTVVDASVVLKWLLAEPSERAQAVLEEHLDGSDRLIAPELLYYEVGNVLVTKVRLDAKAISEIFGYFLDLHIESYSLGTEEYHASIDLAHKYKLTVYDAAYLALALAINVKLVTADKRLATRAAALRVIQTV